MAVVTVFNRKLGADDLAFGTGSYTYHNPITGAVSSVAAINASHIPFAGFTGTIEDLIDGGYDLTGKFADLIVKAPWVDARAYGTLGAQATLTAALAAIGSTACTLYMAPGTWTVSTDTTIPSNVNLFIDKGAVMSVATTKTLTINGPLRAGNYQIFSCTGTGAVAFGDGVVQEVFVEWWGGKGDDSTDNAAALQAAFIAHPCVRLLEGTYLVSATIYLNSTNRSLQYILTGAGKQNTNLEWNTLTAAAYCIKVNEDVAAAKVVVFPTNPRLVVRDIAIYGNTTNNPHFLKVRETGVQLENVRLSDHTDGVVTDDYCDQVIMQNVYWGTGPTTGFLAKELGNGDAWRLENIFVDNYYAGAALHEKGIYSGGMGTGHFFGNIVGGYFDFDGAMECEINAWHCEDTGAIYPITVVDSVLTVRNCWIRNSESVYPIYVNDSTVDYGGHSILRLIGNTFNTYIGAVNQYRNSDIFINSLSQGQIILQNNRCGVMASGRWITDDTGIVVGATDATFNTMLGQHKNKRLLSGEAIIAYEDTTYRVRPLNGFPRFMAMSNAVVIYAKGTSTDFVSNLSGTTYYYKAAVYLDDGLHTAVSAEVSQLNVVNQEVYLKIAFRHPQSILRVWRGTASVTYDRYVDIPVLSERTILHDCGTHLSGYVWIQAPPAIPATPSDNTIITGYELPNGKRVFWAAAAPTSGEYTAVVGDVIWDTDAATAVAGWYCITAGTPGVYKTLTMQA